MSKGKKDSLTLSFDEFLSTLGDAESMGFNVEWLKSHVIALKDLKKARAFCLCFFVLTSTIEN